MNQSKWMAVAVIGLAVVCLRGRDGTPTARAAVDPRADLSGDLAVVTVNSPTGDNLVVIDRQRRVMAVYRIDENGAAIHLRSVRDIRWDMMLEEFNPSTPRPADVKAMLEQK